MKGDPVEDFILQSERNLKIAEAVANAWPVARTTLVDGFLNRLGRKLVKRLPGWEFEPYETFFIHHYANLTFWKRSWKDQYWVALQCREGGQRMEMGIMRNEGLPKVKKRPYSSELLAALQKINPSAKKSAWFDGSITMRSPASDWSKPEVLWKLHKDNKFLDDVAEQLVAIAKVGEPIVDQLSRTK